MMRFNFELFFSRSYDVEQLDELPGSGARVEYFPASPQGLHADGVILKVTHQTTGRSWIGVFAFGYRSPACYSGVLSCPDPNTICVVSSGLGIFVSALDPSKWEKVSVFPVIHARQSLDHNIIVFADMTKLSAYGVNGLLWNTKELSWDGVKLIEINDKEAVGTAWDAPTERDVSFRVDLRTGVVAGGAAPPMDSGTSQPKP